MDVKDKNIIPRTEYLKKIDRLIDKEIIKSITGIRRSGKSFLLKQIITKLKDKGIKDENILLFNFETREYRNIKNDTELDEIVYQKTKNLNGKVYLLFDEIQNVKNWEKSINSYRVDFDSDIYITGSNSMLLSGELATHLTGRCMEITIYPLSFSEYYIYKKTDTIQENLEKENIFNEYMLYGGMPYLIDLSDEDKMDYLNAVHTSILYEDIVKRYEIRDIELLERLIEFITDNIGNIFSANSIKDYFKHEQLKISTKTIYNYLNYLEQSFFIKKVLREDIKGKKRLKINEKYYLIDHGFINMLIDNNMSNKGRILENIVYLELLKKGYNITIGKIYDKEIDFICKKGKEKMYIQVTYSMQNKPETEKREFTPLKKIKDNYNKYVISMDINDFSQDGIEHYNVIDFLLNEL